MIEHQYFVDLYQRHGIAPDNTLRRAIILILTDLNTMRQALRNYAFVITMPSKK